MTGHSAQGLSTSGPITIYDIYSRHICRKWLYVALTRARNPEDLYYHSDPYEEMAAESKTPVGMLKTKIAGYQTQDAVAGRYWNDGTYITVEDVLAMEPICHICGTTCLTEYVAGDTAQLTLDRIDNRQPHVKGNVVVACLSCNCAKK